MKVRKPHLALRDAQGQKCRLENRINDRERVFINGFCVSFLAARRCPAAVKEGMHQAKGYSCDRGAAVVSPEGLELWTVLDHSEFIRWK